MAREKITKEEAERIMKEGGKVRGLTLKTDADYIIEKEGKEGLKRVEERLKELGYPIKFKNFSSFGWYSLPLSAIIITVMVEVFDWDDSAIFDLAYTAPLNTTVSKMMLERLLNLERLFAHHKDLLARHR